MVHSIAISSELTSINDVRYFLEKIFGESNLDKENFNRIFLALSEAVNNSIVHGNLYSTSKKVYVRIFHDDINLIVEVNDEGQGFSVDCIEDPTCMKNLKNEKGRGIFLMRQVAEEVVYSDGGRKVSIRFKIV